MLPNPYTPGEAPPRVFVGRETEMERLRDRLARVIAYGEMMGPLTVLAGPRGVGKTSLLRAVQADAAAGGFVTAWSSCVKDQPFLGDVLHSVRRELVGVGALDEPRGARIDELGVEVGVGVAKLSAKVSPGRRPAVPAALVGPLEDFFLTTSTLAREFGGVGLLVLIDEIHAAHLPDAAVLLNAAQNMTGQRERFPLAIIGAGLPSAVSHLTHAATFGERTTERSLTVLDEATSRELLVKPAAELGVRWSAAALDLAVGAARGYPHFLHLVGEATWFAAQPAKGALLDAADVRRGTPDVESGVNALFRARWENATAAERSFLQAMATSGNDVVKRSEIADALGVSTRALSVDRRNLLDKGLVEAPQRGYLTFSIPGFGQFVRDMTD
ncbi:MULTISPECIES: ATP-binding protein [Nocardioides]|uniref:AAA family ATPase n=1 Tax=Nocardioides vastitatis TaxID=2568655 RepID=A0ABW0ZG81_9ACTN|nr:ATP-binding protein [Nocardioides sp.]THI96639.1 ATP-binding protein [Nocardioides sp.]